ncbi:MAG: heavy metal translocating P-type ATPase metal-binding domain-containing protein [Flavobacteriales bacterium]|nr:heavy metal translocating P-type ATPase metal-binding domain-containing protein [Flavobacteriales bacterium]
MIKTEAIPCYHCGDDCENDSIQLEEKNFCCNGCKSVYEILNQNDLGKFYELESNPGIKKEKQRLGQYKFLDIEEIATPLFDFSEGDTRVIRLFLPSIHCVSCIWLLENLNKINKGIISSQVNFLKKEALISFNVNEISLRELAVLVDKIGYAPKFDAEKKKEVKNKKSYIKLGLTLFCFGNIMLFSFPEYLNPDASFLEFYRAFFAYLIFAFSVPILVYSAQDYLVSAFKAIKTSVVNLDVPITLGILTLYFKSAYDIFSGNGPGYMDSFAGFILFLLIGKWFQDKTYDALSFERDYRSYFPLAITQLVDGKEIVKPVKDVVIGDRLMIKNDEIIPTDAVIIKGNASIDYSFVTGESKLVTKKVGNEIFAGGKQSGNNIEIEVIKTLNQSYLTQLWNQHAFKKEDSKTLENINSKLSHYFIIIVLLIALITGIVWSFIAPEHIFNVLVAVLIVACPCAIALSIPFTFGNALRVAGENKLYLKNADVIEKLGKVTDIVFDKTGTLTFQHESDISFIGNDLNNNQKQLIFSIVRNSSHPLSRTLYKSLKNEIETTKEVENYKEVAGKGIFGEIENQTIYIGSQKWVEAENENSNLSTCIYIKISGKILGFYQIENSYRTGFEKTITTLKKSYRLHLLSGDNESEKTTLLNYFDADLLHFNQQPIDKLNYIKSIKNRTSTIMMIGDGLNDAGALKQSDVGIVISEDVYNFTPACDGILDASMFTKIPKFIQLGKYSLSVLRVSYTISLLYNLVGLSFAVTNQLSPLIAAILMPLSSISVILIATLLVRFYGRKQF